MKLPVLKGIEVNLRPLRMSDEGSLQRCANDPAVAYFLARMPSPHTSGDARQWIRKTASMARGDSGYYLGIARAENDEIIGVIGLRNLKPSDKKAELTYWLGRRFWKKGLMSEAVPLMLRFAFRELKLNRVHALVHERNIGSIRVLEKAGFTREAVYRKASFKGRRWGDIYGFGILKGEFSARVRKK
jgi:RimJ/RimL family protein N-acetyltransferase